MGPIRKSVPCNNEVQVQIWYDASTLLVYGYKTAVNCNRGSGPGRAGFLYITLSLVGAELSLGNHGNAINGVTMPTPRAYHSLGSKMVDAAAPHYAPHPPLLPPIIVPDFSVLSLLSAPNASLESSP
ncbi:hypothetical protein J6590_029769 [Homalodisca vitripennis]|nr:hypothetical protein J6590_029769 [Homalodisca vitripennis]